MDDLVSRALDLAEVRGAGYADIRIVRTSQERISLRNGVVDTLSVDESLGFGVRVLVNGCWGFASSHDLTGKEIDRITALAVDIARAVGTEVLDSPAEIVVTLDQDVIIELLDPHRESFGLPPVEASYAVNIETDTVRIVPSRLGTKLDAEAVADALPAAGLGSGTGPLPVADADPPPSPTPAAQAHGDRSGR